VTLDEAIAELRIDRGTSPDQARRAYLRLLKERKPEVDPDGFQRLREAYELLRSSLGWRQGAAGRVTAPLFVAIPLRAPGSEPAREATERETTALEPTRPETSAGSPTELRDEQDVPHETAADPRPVVVPSAAIPVLPKPASPPDPDIARLNEVGRLLSTKHRQRAASLLAEHYEAAVARPGIAVPPPAETLDLLLRAHEKGWLSVAARLERAFALWLDAMGAEVRVLGGKAPQWAVAREFGALPSQLSPEVRSVMARAARTGELDQAMISLRQIGARDRSEAKKNAKLLRRDKRPFSTKVAGALAPPRWNPLQGQWRRSMIVLSFVLSALLRILHCEKGVDSPVATVSALHIATVAPAALQAAAQSADALAKLADSNEEGLLGDRARAVRAMLQAGDCAEALPLMTDLLATPMNLGFKQISENLAATVKQACAARSEDTP
jgi:hypothetical protein